MWSERGDGNYRISACCMEEKVVVEETVEEPLAVIVTLVAVLTEVALVVRRKQWS